MKQNKTGKRPFRYLHICKTASDFVNTFPLFKKIKLLGKALLLKNALVFCFPVVDCKEQNVMVLFFSCFKINATEELHKMHSASKNIIVF